MSIKCQPTLQHGRLRAIGPFVYTRYRYIVLQRRSLMYNVSDKTYIDTYLGVLEMTAESALCMVRLARTMLARFHLIIEGIASPMVSLRV